MSDAPPPDPPAVKIVPAGAAPPVSKTIGIGVGLVLVMTGLAAAAGHVTGDGDGRSAQVLKARREMLRKIDKATADADREIKELTPVVAKLQQEEQTLEQENSAALQRLRALATVDCSVDGKAPAAHITLTRPASASVGTALAERLREDFPCGVGDVDEDGTIDGYPAYSEAPTTTLDVVEFGTVDVGDCAGAKVVRMSFFCSYVSFDQNCAGDYDECERFKEPAPTFKWDDDWGCVRTGHSGKTSLATPQECEKAEEAKEEWAPTPTTSEAHLYFFFRGQQAIYLPTPSSGWPALSDAEVAPGQRHEEALSLAVRADPDLALHFSELPDVLELDIGGKLYADGRASLDANPPRGEDLTSDDDLYVAEDAFEWNVFTEDGRVRRYVDRIEPTQDLSTYKPTLPGVTIGGEHVCRRSAERAPADDDARGRFTKIADGLYVEGTPAQEEQKLVFWVDSFGHMWRCQNRKASPHAAEPDDPPWEPNVTDEEKQEFARCFQ